MDLGSCYGMPTVKKGGIMQKKKRRKSGIESPSKKRQGWSPKILHSLVPLSGLTESLCDSFGRAFFDVDQSQPQAVLLFRDLLLYDQPIAGQGHTKVVLKLLMIGCK